MKPFLALCTALLLASAGHAAATTLVYAANGDPVTFDSGNITDGVSVIYQLQVYDTLVGFVDGTTDTRPALATSWKPNANATSWTFNLRRNVKFHDGTPFNADAVLFNWNRFWDPAAPNGYRDQGRTYDIVTSLLGGFKGQPNAIIKNIVKVDDFTVRFDLNKPSTVFAQVVGTGFFGIASPTAVKAQGAKYGTPASKPVGTGPFIFGAWKTGDRVTYTRNPNYWGTKAKVDTLIVRGIKDASQRLNELKAGSVDLVGDINPDSLKALKADSNLQVVLRPSFNVGFISLNNRNQYLKNDKVRQAISMAINKPAIVEAFWNGLGTSNASFLPKALAWANSKNVPADYKFDPAAAKKLLAEAGYPNGFTLDFWYLPIARPFFPLPKPIAEAISADLSAIGIKVNLKTEDYAKYLKDRYQEPGFDIYMIGWTGDYGDPDNFYSAFYGPGGSDDINWNPPELNALLEKGRATVARDDKAKIYAQIQEMTYNANYRIPIVHSQPLGAARTYVKGWIANPLGTGALNNVSVPGKK
ncbi:ABC transporter substrate-binding protein [Deinococcus humi]|uniref:Peptide/nickel transport system substrate-binding protein n=1 Tax=Deinococcus humi TaxID=662880 RepID=A0A7W8JXJ3_9DEIO|nr:ABC transporter substrate-binding protein [Deinococcus humi]MBB5363566.1 peptide/nickel transport system substrate-binding protein [Deinococcus humi]GGO30228.1 ABC transporter substrate-binding protein [Deinococcus humi]